VMSRYYSFVGIAVASSIAAWINAIALIITSVRRGHYVMDPRFRQRLPRILASVLVMGLVLGGEFYLMSSSFAETASFWRRILSLGLFISTASLAYFVASHFSGALRLSELKSAFRS
jgi:putative peptidoglycan lipid II flippase